MCHACILWSAPFHTSKILRIWPNEFKLGTLRAAALPLPSGHLTAACNDGAHLLRFLKFSLTPSLAGGGGFTTALYPFFEILGVQVDRLRVATVTIRPVVWDTILCPSEMDGNAALRNWEPWLREGPELIGGYCLSREVFSFWGQSNFL